MQVPLWVYLLTTFGVAFIGVGGVMLSTRHAGKQTDKQLQRDRERSEEARVAAETDWVKGHKVVVYTEFVEALNAYEQQSRDPMQRPSERVDFRPLVSSLMMWSGPDVWNTIGPLLEASLEVTHASLDVLTDDTPEARSQYQLRRKAWSNQSVRVLAAIRDELGVFPRWPEGYRNPTDPA